MIDLSVKPFLFYGILPKEPDVMAVFRVEKNQNYTVMSNYHLKDKSLSLKSKGLLSLILSLPDEWNYTTRGLAAISKEGVDCIGGVLKELEKAGYLIRNRLRDERGRISDTEYIIYEYPQATPDTGKLNTALPYTENPYMDNPGPEMPAQINTNKVIPNAVMPYKSNINPSIQPRAQQNHTPSMTDESGADAIRTIEIYRNIIHENIGYDQLCQQNIHSIQEIDEIVEIMLETICSKRPTIRVGREDVPAELVRSRLLKLDDSHIEYVLESLDKNTTAIRNIKSYLLTTIYNATITMNNHYKAAVNHDLYAKPNSP